MTTYIPKQGDLLLIDLSPTRGHEQRGKRPVVVLSPEKYNAASGLMLVCPITTRIKHYPFEYPLPPSATLSGVALLDQLRSVDWQVRRSKKQGTVSKTWLTSATSILQLLLP